MSEIMNPESLDRNLPAKTARPTSSRRARVSTWAHRLAFLFVLIITTRHAARRLPPIWAIPTDAKVISFTPDGTHLWTSENSPNSNRWRFTKHRSSDGAILQSHVVDFATDEVERVEINATCDTIACLCKPTDSARPACLIDTATGATTYTPTPVLPWDSGFSPTLQMLTKLKPAWRTKQSVSMEEFATGKVLATFDTESFDGLQMEPQHCRFSDSESLLAISYNSSFPDALNCRGAILFYDVKKRQTLARHVFSKPGYWIPSKWIGNRLFVSRHVMDNAAQRSTVEHYSYVVDKAGQLSEEKLVYAGFELMDPTGRRCIEIHRQLFLDGPWVLRWDQTSVQRQLTDTGHWVDRLLASLGPASIDRTCMVNLETDQQLIQFDQLLLDGHSISKDGRYLAGNRLQINHPPPFDQWFPHVPAIACYQIDPLAQRQNLSFRIACGIMAFLTSTAWLRWELKRPHPSRAK